LLAVLAERFPVDDPLGVAARDIAEPEAPADLATVEVRAASRDQHDLWSLRGVGLTQEQLPMVLGTDGAGIDDKGRRDVVHAVIDDPAAGDRDETLDPKRLRLSERSVVRSTIGTRDQLVTLLDLLERTGLRPSVDSVRPLEDGPAAAAALAAGEVHCKAVLVSA